MVERLYSVASQFGLAWATLYDVYVGRSTFYMACYSPLFPKVLPLKANVIYMSARLFFVLFSYFFLHEHKPF